VAEPGSRFGVATKATRLILRRPRVRPARGQRGGGAHHPTLGAADWASGEAPDLDVEALDKALTRFAVIDRERSCLVGLRYFVGLRIEDAVAVLGSSPATVKRQWSVAPVRLRHELTAGNP
jgi:hypothetical protein